MNTSSPTTNHTKQDQGRLELRAPLVSPPMLTYPNFGAFFELGKGCRQHTRHAEVRDTIAETTIMIREARHHVEAGKGGETEVASGKDDEARPPFSYLSEHPDLAWIVRFCKSGSCPLFQVWASANSGVDVF